MAWFRLALPVPPLPLLFLKIAGMANDLCFYFGTLFSRISHRANYAPHLLEPADSNALFVLLHGLNSHPSCFDGHRDAIARQAEQKGIRPAFLQPHVVKRGNCSNAEAQAAIQAPIENWAQRHPESPILLFGVSNGARLSAHIAVALAQRNITNPVAVYAIAGPFNGTKVLRPPSARLESLWLRLIRICRLSEEIVEELIWEGDRSLQLIAAMRRWGDEIRWHFYGTLGDWKVVDPHSSLPLLPNCRVDYRMEKLAGHSSIVGAVRERSVSGAIDFARCASKARMAKMEQVSE